ncbi:hypothetical protein QQ054_18120 [Oscillatoria amoena NRMC-F 0135]|nr:hypothetical protein [Oscillatoria amoena NRMC-F 0135]
MKTLLPVVLLLTTFSALAQSTQAEMGFGYTYTAPVNTMKQNISGGNGFTMDYYIIPANNKRLALGTDFNFTIYGYDKSRQEYTFGDGTIAPMDIIVNNTFMNIMLGGRYYITPIEGKAIRPYLNVRGGYAWFRTNVNIYDPDDTDHCKPVDRDLLMKDGTLTISGGGGLHWDLSSIFKRRPPDTFLFNLSANLTLGGRVTYMNTDGPEPGHAHQTTDVTARFINTQTQVVHEHHVGYVYSSFVEMVELRAGFIFRWDSSLFR